MKATSGCLALGLAMALAIVGAARAADRPQPGLWEVITKHERGGVGKSDPAKQRCITAEQAKSFGSRDAVPVANSRNGMTCKLADWQAQPDGTSWRIACTGAVAAEQTGRYVFDSAQHFTATMTTTVSTPGRERVSVLTIESRRIGECPK
ncbi:MAG: DUF3617 family protein [Proteobacteria bacterium]|nr:DUF3617 family protein [Pseudomonadota bacterium]